jgi:hypothetical protein
MAEADHAGTRGEYLFALNIKINRNTNYIISKLVFSCNKTEENSVENEGSLKPKHL